MFLYNDYIKAKYNYLTKYLFKNKKINVIYKQKHFFSQVSFRKSNFQL